MMKSLMILPILWLLTGCAAALPALPALSGLIPGASGTHILTTTKVNLSRKNFKLVNANVVGSSVGFSLLGLFSLKSPSYEEALTQLYRSADVSVGKPQALVNVMHEQTSTYFILFALPKITVRADVIEFIDDVAPISIRETQNMH
ncbi:MAG: hypothetical protein PHO08_18960 [Methylococcales bacterium]|nr:hypothetical protein [Methylococcales bacterium]MDD5631640.1 hypothetical protein [Methylococcales bacterium]